MQHRPELATPSKLSVVSREEKLRQELGLGELIYHRRSRWRSATVTGASEDSSRDLDFQDHSLPG